MKLLVIGTDRTIFDSHAPARKRINAYAELFDELHVIVFTPKGFSEVRAGRLTLYPTNSRRLFRRPFDAVTIGARMIRERRIDEISVQDPSESGLAGWLLKRKTGTSLHIQIHTDILAPAFRKNSWREYIRYLIARFVIRRGDRFRVVSERVRASLRAFGIPDAKITLLPIFDTRVVAGVSPTFDLRRRYPEFSQVILMVSRLVREKNIRLALEAFVTLLGGFPDAGLIIVGDGPERTDIEERIRDMGLSRRVHLTGWQDDLVPYYQGADCYLLTSNFEGYGRSVIDAVLVGTPVVMTDVGVAGDIIRDGETGRVVPIGDRVRLQEALQSVLRNHASATTMAARARKEFMERGPHTWEEYLERYRDSLQ